MPKTNQPTSLHSSFTKYFIGLTLPEPENRLITKIKIKYHPHKRLTSPPHITLIPPFLMPNQAYLNEKLVKLTQNLTPFTTELNMIGSWRQLKYGTVFLETKKSEPIKQIVRLLEENIAFLPKQNGFYPHLTVAQRVPLDQLKQTKNEIRALNLKLKMIVDSLTLFYFDSSESAGVWQIRQKYPFKEVDKLKTIKLVR